MSNNIARLKRLRHTTGLGLKEAYEIVMAGKDDEVLATWGNKAPAALPNLYTMMAPLMPTHPARQDYDSLRGEVETLKRLLSELHTMVWGECPALLDGERGGSDHLDTRIEEALG